MAIILSAHIYIIIGVYVTIIANTVLTRAKSFLELRFVFLVDNEYNTCKNSMPSYK